MEKDMSSVSRVSCKAVLCPSRNPHFLQGNGVPSECHLQELG